MHLIDYINIHEDWEERLSDFPYNLKIKTDGRYKLLEYHFFESNFYFGEVMEARGCIIKKDFNNKWVYVCKPFNKFFNYGSSYASYIDWNSKPISITEKIDGSLMKLWYEPDEMRWHLSTSGTIDAFKTYFHESNLTFGNIFERILGCSINTFAKDCFLNTKYTYCFEMTSPETKIVIPYTDGIYYLTSFHTATGTESCSLTNFTKEEMERYGINFPTTYHLNSIEEVIDFVQNLDASHEGVVIRDAYGRRVKVKTLDYLFASKIFAKGEIKKADILKLIRENKIDDLIEYFPEYNVKALEVKQEVEEFINSVLHVYNTYHTITTRKELASKIKNFNGAYVVFKKYNNPNLDVRKYVWEDLRLSRLIRLLGYKEK